MKKITPITRIFDENKAKEFYVDFLEFRIDWEHRYEDDLPLYMQVSSGDCEIHLSGHHGDCCPGSAIRVEVEDIRSLHAKLIAKKYKHARPGLEQMDVSVVDPFGNRITFFERKDA